MSSSVASESSSNDIVDSDAIDAVDNDEDEDEEEEDTFFSS
jgi:hypothetical protein